jgi:hypothetical protein
MLLYTELAQQIMRDVARRVRDFRHLDPERIALLAAARCTGGSNGNLATCYGLRQEVRPTFSIWTRPRTRQVVAVTPWFAYRTPRVRLANREMSYLILLRMPRMLRTNPLLTIVHELYHISEAFDTTMRPVRHGAFFNHEVKRLAQTWLERATGDLPRLAQLRFYDLQREFGAILAEGVPSRFAIPIVEEIEPTESYAAGLARLYPGHTLARGYAVRPIETTPEDAPRYISENNLDLRHVSPSGSEKMPAAFARYSRRYLALTA